MIVTNKKAQSFSLVDAQTLTEVVRVPTTKKIVHGVAYSPDGRYAFISQESIGADPGAVDMFDLARRKIVATLPVPAQPTGMRSILPKLTAIDRITDDQCHDPRNPDLARRRRVLARAKQFFQERVPATPPFPRRKARPG